MSQISLEDVKKIVEEATAPLKNQVKILEELIEAQDLELSKANAESDKKEPVKLVSVLVGKSTFTAKNNSFTVRTDEGAQVINLLDIKEEELKKLVQKYPTMFKKS